MRASDITFKNVLEGLVLCEIKQKDLDGYYGLYDYNTKTVYLDPNNRMKARIDTLVHEAIHAYHDSVGIPENEELTRKQTKIIMKRIYGGRQ